MWPGPYGDWGSRKYLLASLDQSLTRMGLDYVDIFYHHRPDPDTPLEGNDGGIARRGAGGQGAVRGDLVLPAGPDPAGRADPRLARHALPGPSTQIQHAGARNRAGPA